MAPRSTKTVEELMKTSQISDRYWNEVDASIWYNEPSLEETNEIALTTYTARKITDYTDSEDMQGPTLLAAFKEDFEDWNEARFNLVHKEYRRSLRLLLRKRGIYTGNLLGKIAPQLSQLLDIEDLPEWHEIDPKDFMRMRFDEETYALRLREKLESTPTNSPPAATPTPKPTPRSTPPPAAPPAAPTPIAPTLAVPPQSIVPSQPTPQTWQPQHTPQPQLTTHPTSYVFRHPSIQPRAAPVATASPAPIATEFPASVIAPTVALDLYTTIPPEDFPNEPTDTDVQQRFTKIWNKRKTYTGEPYDLLDDILKVFLSVCFHNQIRPGQFHALFPHIISGRAEVYYVSHVDWTQRFRQVYDQIKKHFDTEVNHNHYYTDWTTTTFTRVRAENPEKNLQEVLQKLLDKLQLCQRALGKQFEGDVILRTTVINACRGVPELEYALFNAPTGTEKLFADLRSSIETHLARGTGNSQFFLDRRYHGGDRRRPPFRGYNGRRGGGGHGGGYGGERQGRKRCFICKKEGCWSTKHTREERDRARAQYAAECDEFAAYMCDCESEANEEDDAEDSEIGDEDNAQAEAWLCQQSFMHQITGEDIYAAEQPDTIAEHFTIENRYSRDRFQGIMVDTGAASVSTAGRGQLQALQKELPTTTLELSTAGQASVRFGNGEVIHSIGTVVINLPVGQNTFHVLDTPTPFLFSLADMDRLGVYFDNTRNELVTCGHDGKGGPGTGDRARGNGTIPVVRKWGHPWFFLSKLESTTAFLTEKEIRTLHRRFGHPAVARLQTLLKLSGNEAPMDVLEGISKMCHHCQMHGQAPRRFKFNLKDDQEFNYEIIADVMHLNGKPTLL